MQQLQNTSIYSTNGMVGTIGIGGYPIVANMQGSYYGSGAAHNHSFNKG